MKQGKKKERGGKKTKKRMGLRRVYIIEMMLMNNKISGKKGSTDANDIGKLNLLLKRNQYNNNVVGWVFGEGEKLVEF